MKKHNVKDVVRVCEPTYKVDELKQEGINVIDLVFDDGTFPPNEVNKFYLRDLDVAKKNQKKLKTKSMESTLIYYSLLISRWWTNGLSC